MKEDKFKSNDLGNQFLDKIEDCLDNMDYSALGDSIRESVDFIRKEAENGYKAFQVKKSKEFEKYNKNIGTPYERYRAAQNREQYVRHIVREETYGQRVSLKNKPLPLFRNIPGSLQGPLEIVSGVGAIALFGAAALGFGFLAALGAAAGVMHTVALGGSVLGAALGGTLIGHGIFAKNRADRIKKYENYLRGKEYIMVEDLANQSLQSKEQIIKDTHFIIDQNILPNLSIDEKETCLLLSDGARKQYEDAEKARLEREIEEIRQKEEEENLARKKAEASKEEREWYDFEEKVNAFLDELRMVKKEIDTPVMQEHMDKIEVLLSQIYVCIKEHPEMVGGTGHLASYYLPCMSKLFKTYEDLEEQPIQGENILKTKQEIENSFETIEAALKNMYDELFLNVSMDISSDIQVMKTMMAQDGLNQEL